MKIFKLWLKSEYSIWGVCFLYLLYLRPPCISFWHFRNLMSFLVNFLVFSNFKIVYTIRISTFFYNFLIEASLYQFFIFFHFRGSINYNFFIWELLVSVLTNVLLLHHLSPLCLGGSIWKETPFPETLCELQNELCQTFCLLDLPHQWIWVIHRDYRQRERR